MTYEQQLRRIADQDPSVVVMTAENRAAIRGLPPFLGDRFIDVGICEQTMIGAAAGLALRGRKPVVHALSTFLTLRAFEFIRTDVGIGNLPVKLIGGVPGFLSEANGPTHQAIEDVALMRGIPNMHVFTPADEAELVEALPAIVDCPAPCYVRFNAVKPVREARQPFAVGRSEQIGSGNDVTILVYGFLLGEALRAQELLEDGNISTGVINLRTLAPVDEAALLGAAARSRLVVTVEDHFQTGGLYSILSELLLSHGTTAAVLPIALKNRWFTPSLLPDILEHEGFNGPRLAQRIRDRFVSVS